MKIVFFNPIKLYTCSDLKQVSIYSEISCCGQYSDLFIIHSKYAEYPYDFGNVNLELYTLGWHAKGVLKSLDNFMNTSNPSFSTVIVNNKLLNFFALTDKVNRKQKNWTIKLILIFRVTWVETSEWLNKRVSGTQ